MCCLGAHTRRVAGEGGRPSPTDAPTPPHLFFSSMRATVTLRAVSLTSEGFRLVAAHAAPMRASVRLAPPRTSSVVAHGGRLRVRANAAEDAQQKPSLGAMETGTAVVVIELPPFVKTSNNIPAMRDASKVISVGEPGRCAHWHIDSAGWTPGHRKWVASRDSQTLITCTCSGVWPEAHPIYE